MLFDSNNTCAATTGAAPRLFASAINFLAASQFFMPDSCYHYTEGPEVYDFIIVGAGSAGSVVANRLSEIKNWNILLLEAGPQPPIESDIPYMSASLYHTKYDWEYYTQNDGVRHQALKNGSVHWPRGKMLGGSSSINQMAYIRGRDKDFKEWENAGNPSWTPENVNSYFRKVEGYQNAQLLEDIDISNTYGHYGPQVINTFNSTYRYITEKVLESWDSIGLKRIKDINAAKFEGMGLSGIYSVTAANGRRYSTHRSYLDPIKERKNLKIVTNAFVTKILINDEKKAYAVEVDILGVKKTFYAKMEIIISAGTINTPQLLMLSGIGPEEHLLSKNISCIVNLPAVGKNLHDHNYIPIIIYGDDTETEREEEQIFEVIKYMYNKTGLLAQNSYSDITALFSLNQSMEYPEFQSHFGFLRKNSQSAKLVFEIYNDETIDSLLKPHTNKALYIFSVHLLHPYSRGSIYLKSSNPYDHPTINANYFGDDKDLKATVGGINMILKVLKTPYFRSINAFVQRINIPECNQHEFESDLYWECYAVSICATVNHPVGTSKMGPDPKDSVVNNYLKLHGVRNIRIIDASVMPSITSGNTNAPTIMIGEMGSDMIKTDYLNHKTEL